MGIKFAGLSAELDATLRAHVRRKWPHISSWDDIATLSTEMLVQQFCQTRCTCILLVAGAPCQPFSSLGRQQGFADARSLPLQRFFVFRDELQAFCQGQDVPFHWMLEEVATMSAVSRQQITDLAGTPPVLLQAADFGWVHRSR
eukprot:2405872-Amphidinium_carterae.1